MRQRALWQMETTFISRVTLAATFPVRQGRAEGVAVVITIPVILVGYLQWGFTPEYAYMLIAYFIVQGLDANLLVPILFSEAVNLHPIAIVIAILVFGGFGGFWGIFFAIPLATLVKTIISVWPTT